MNLKKEKKKVLLRVYGALWIYGKKLEKGNTFSKNADQKLSKFSAFEWNWLPKLNLFYVAQCSSDT